MYCYWQRTKKQLGKVSREKEETAWKQHNMYPVWLETRCMDLKATKIPKAPPKKNSNNFLQGLACPENCTIHLFSVGQFFHTGETGVCIFWQGFNSIRIIYKSLPQMRLWLTSVTKTMLNKTPGLHQWQGHQAIENKRTKTCKTVQFVYVSYLNAWSQPSD